MPSVSGMSPWAKRDRGVTSKRLQPEADQSRCASSKLVALRDPERLAATFTHELSSRIPVGLAALARARAIAKEEAAAEADSVRGIIGQPRLFRRFHRRSTTPRDARRAPHPHRSTVFELGIGQEAVAQHGSRQFRAVGRFRGRDRGHRR